ncbi:hypothetical protein Pint_09007 [Pistacia integerrima]|uniref:Uncharacterized protein n=1 Tax=Pistacia integerrima TaxID=434235 RepID=A0ACC0XX49_9ROSI|nr:hypothetical protein Pint_09007 [Pistacia integerrima]
MESANVHHQHQLQDQLVGSSSLPTPSCYGVASSHAWTPIPNPNVTLNAGNFNPNYNGFILNSRQKNEIHVPPPNSSMIQESGLHWINNAGTFTSQSAHDIHFSKIKEELSDSFPKFTDMLNSPSNIEDSHLPPTSYLKNERKGLNDDLSEKLLLKTISSGFPLNANQFSGGEFYSNAQNVSSLGSAIPSRGNFSQIYPSINISNLNQSSSATSSSFDMNLQALDLLTSSRFSGNFCETSHNNLGAYRESLPFGLDDHMQQSRRRPSSSPTKISSPFTSEITEAKRSSGSIEPKALQSAQKKSRLESRASCPPFKVRKEKLGDRIAALQQLVAPFGKTDTASVLMEAIGYIKFLQNQVETLSVPYMKSSRNKTCRIMQGGSMAENVNEEPNRDLRSRGLCLVPLSCMSYVTNDGGGGGGIWPPPNFGEGT